MQSLVSEMICNVLLGALNLLTHSLTYCSFHIDSDLVGLPAVQVGYWSDVEQLQLSPITTVQGWLPCLSALVINVVLLSSFTAN